ncbi:MAG: hypothetical protein IPI60_13715 [Saprospiraceae bacterium]|nr:hypothetical protein [Saprospiraceae bacterium]
MINLFSNAIVNLPSSALYGTDTYQFWYDLADIVSIAGSAIQFDFIGEGGGLIATLFDDQTDRRILNTSAYWTNCYCWCSSYNV